MINLGFDDLTLRLNPELGGSVESFLQGNTPILRSALPGPASPLNQAAYPLVPFSGRIDHGQFDFDGRSVTLPSNMPPEPHAIHGQGWQSAWQVKSHHDHVATIVFDYSGSDWPWRYRAEQTFELSAGALNLTMRLQNLANTPMPAGLGWHPFFPKDDAQLTANVELIWPNGSDAISQPPIYSNEVEMLNSGIPVRDLALDNAFTATSAGTQMRWGRCSRTISLQATDNLGHLIIYTPTEEDFFCVEPVSHAPNSLNSALPSSVTGAKVLSTNQTMTARIKLSLG